MQFCAVKRPSKNHNKYYVIIQIQHSNSTHLQMTEWVTKDISKETFLETRLLIRVRPRFFDQVGPETEYASSGNKHFFTKSCHHQTYQNYEQPPRTSQNLYFLSHFSVLKIGQIFPKNFFYEKYLTKAELLLLKLIHLFASEL